MNKLYRLISALLIVCLFATSTLPTSIFAYTNDGGGHSSYSPGSSSGWSGNASHIKGGGYRFTLLFLGSEVRDPDMYDQCGNVNIDKWSTYVDNVNVIGWIDVAYDNSYDKPDYYYYDGNAFTFDLANKENRRLYSGSRPLKYVNDLKKLAVESGYMSSGDTFNFSWQLNDNIGKNSIGDVLSEVDSTGEKIQLDLYPGSGHTYEMAKHIPTAECATIIKAICQANSDDKVVLCESAEKKAGREVNPSDDNVFEYGRFNGKEGSYKLLIEPYELTKVGNTTIVMTLRDVLWKCNQLTGSDGRYGGWLANDVGGYLALLGKVNYMPRKDIFGINTDYNCNKNVATVEELSEIEKFDPDNYSPNRGKMKELNNRVKTQNMGYGISSFSSDMCKTIIREMFIGSISNVFLPGTLQDGTGLNTDVKSYSIEYRGDKQSQDKLKDYQTELVKSLKTSIEGEISRDVTTAEEIIENNQLSSLDDSTYKNLLENVQKQLEESYPVTIYGNSVKAVTTDIFDNSSFKTFITSMYNQIITQSHTGSDGTVLMDTVFFMLF